MTEPRTGLQARLGYRGPVVRDLRDSLTAAGGLGKAPDWSSTTVEVFDEDLDAAVRSFQQERGLLVDGIVGPWTFAALDAALRSRRCVPLLAATIEEAMTLAADEEPDVALIDFHLEVAQDGLDVAERLSAMAPAPYSSRSIVSRRPARSTARRPITPAAPGPNHGPARFRPRATAPRR